MKLNWLVLGVTAIVLLWASLTVYKLVSVGKVLRVPPPSDYELSESMDEDDPEDVFSDNPESGALRAARSGKWKAVRAAHLLVQPRCLACDSEENLNVHHLIPFHVDPSKECDPSNLATACREHHYFIFHDPDGPGPEKPSWSKHNANAVRDAFQYRREHGLPDYKYGSAK